MNRLTYEPRLLKKKKKRSNNIKQIFFGTCRHSSLIKDHFHQPKDCISMLDDRQVKFIGIVFKVPCDDAGR